MAEGIQISVFAPSDLTTALDVIGRRWEPSMLEEHNRDGGGSFRLRTDDQALDETPNLLDEGNFVQVKVDGAVRCFFEIKRKKIIVVAEGEYAGEWVEAAGPGMLEWFNHATVLPERGISQNVDERVFNFTAATGAWYNAADWQNAVDCGPIHNSTHIDDTLPGKWPVALHANWIWSISSANAPVGDVYIRREFTTAADANYRLVGTADDFAAIYIDGVRVMAITEIEGAMNTYAQDLEIAAGNHVLAIQARNTGGPAGVILALCAVANNKQNEDLKDSERILWTGDDLTKWKVRAYPAIAPGFTVGQILTTLFNEATARNVTSMNRLTLSFTATTDSYGQPWAKTYDMAAAVGDPYRSVIEQITDSYADVWVSPDFKLNAAPVRGVDRSAGSDPVSFRRGLNVLNAETDTTAEIANVAFVKTNNGMVESPGPAESLSKFGRREAFLSAANSSGSETTNALIKQLFDKFAQPRMTPTLTIFADEGYKPWVDFGIGDWILAPSDTDPLVLIKRRIMSISVSENADTGLPTYVCEIDSIQESYEERVNRWLQSIENNNKSGGLTGTSRGDATGGLPAPGSGVSTPPVPYSPDNRQPAAPTGVVVTSDIVTSAKNTPTGLIAVSWAHSGKAIDGSDQIAESYEVWIRENGANYDYYFLGSTSSTVKSLYADGLRIKKVDGTAVQYQVVVRAKADSGRVSDFSQPVTVTMTDDTTAPLKPSTPTVTAAGTAFTIKSDGKDFNGSAPAPDYDRTIVESAATSGAATWTQHSPIYGPGEILVGGFGYTTRWFRVRHVDRSGNVSVPSTAVSAQSVPLVDADIILETIDAAETQIINLGSESIKTGAILEDKLAANAVTLAKLAQTIQTDIGKGVTALDNQTAINQNITNLQTSVNGKNKITNSTVDAAAGTPGLVTGDRWQKWSSLGVTGRLLATWRWNGTAWIAEAMDASYLPLVDIGAGTFGELDGGRLIANSVKTASLLVSDAANYAPSPAESPGDWALTGGATIITTTIDPSGKRHAVTDNAGTAYARAPFKAVREGERLYGYAKIYREAGATQNLYVRYYWYDKDKASLGTAYTDVPNGSNQGTSGSVLDGAVVVPAGAAYARYTLVAGAGTGSAGWYLVNGFKQSSTVLIEDGAVNASKVNAQSVGAAVGTFIELDVSQLRVTGVANMQTAVIDELWTKVVRSRKIIADMLVVGMGENAVVDPYLLDPATNVLKLTGSATNWTIIDGGADGKVLRHAFTGVTGNYVNITPDWVPVEPGKKYRFVYSMGGVSAIGNSPALQATVAYEKIDGTTSYVTWPGSVAGTNASGWVQIEQELLVPSDVVRVRPRIRANSAGTGIVYVRHAHFARKADASLVVDGGISTRHLTVTEDMTVALLNVHKVKAVEIDINDLTADTGYIAVMTGKILTVDSVTSGNIHATNGITAKHTITGATVQTSASSNTGVKLNTAGIRAFSGTGVETFNVDAANGNVSIVGGTLTGPTMQTSALALRGIKFSSTGLRAYSSAGKLKFVLDATEGDVQFDSRVVVGDLTKTHWVMVPWESSTQERAGIWLSNASSGGIGSTETAGFFMDDADDVVNKNTLHARGMNGGNVEVDTRLVAIDFYSGVIYESGGQYKFQGANGSYFTGSLEARGKLLAKDTPATTIAANTYLDGNGQIWKTSSAARFKLDAQPMDLPDSLLDVPVKDWIDKGMVEYQQELSAEPRPHTQATAEALERISLARVAGVIAEEVEAAGGPRFVTYGIDGLIESVSYDRYALARTAVLKRQLDAAIVRIQALESK